MDASAITSAAQAVHQELVRKLAEQARINRLADQLRRARPGTAAPAPGRSGTSGIPGGSSAWPGIAFPSPIPSGAAIRTPGGHTDPHLNAPPDAGSWLSPGAPGSFCGVAALRPPAAPA